MKTTLALSVALLLFGCGGPKQVAPAPVPTNSATAAAEPTVADPDDPTATAPAKPGVKGVMKEALVSDKLPEDLYLTIKVRGHGTMRIKFHTKDAPKNVTNVANLAIKGFYDGLTCHRIIPGFVVQGGDPKGDGTGGPGYTVPAEIQKLHTKGALAMARTGDQVNPKRESSGSQFYLCLQPLPQLDGQYTVIGQLVEGMEVLEALGKVKTLPGDRPQEPVVMEQVTVSAD